jgi:hypothetical protein
MSRGLSVATLNVLRGVRAGERWMMRFDFDSADGGSVGFWAGSFDFPYEGVTYHPGGVLEPEELAWSNGVAQQVGITIRSTPDRSIPQAEDTFAKIETIDYVGRPVTIYAAILDAEGRLVDVIPEWSGKCGPVEHDQDTAKGEAKATMILESDSFDHSRRETATFSPALHRTIFPGDAFFDSIAVASSIRIEVKG